MSRHVTYVAGSSSATVLASLSRFDVDEPSPDGLFTRREMWAWVVHRDELRIDGVQIKPKRGHRIIDGEDIFLVTPEPNAPCYRWTDGGRNAYRISTKKTGCKK